MRQKEQKLMDHEGIWLWNLPTLPPKVHLRPVWPRLWRDVISWDSNCHALNWDFSHCSNSLHSLSSEKNKRIDSCRQKDSSSWCFTPIRRTARNQLDCKVFSCIQLLLLERLELSLDPPLVQQGRTAETRQRSNRQHQLKMEGTVMVFFIKSTVFNPNKWAAVWW